ncbi:hypothetical protein EYZ11_002874 [Aspergillus tanneri]|uniref:Uncharacterized protein n=1 Tax=Aspergillus tanneri TaxID=1220188 RepID=A0A4S3JRT3_9EURO|nr:hypothetical protein EYZ11_002874 [Aspergillus tanneri]
MSESVKDNSQIEEDLATIANSLFIVYDPSFYDLLGNSDTQDEKHVEKIFHFPPPPPYAQRQIHDGSVYVPEGKALYRSGILLPPTGAFSAVHPVRVEGGYLGSSLSLNT